jgi:hypothetical protein
MSTFYTCSIISTSSASSENINTKLVTLTNNEPNIPDRRVVKPSSSLNDYSNIGVYILTEDEILDLRNDSGIKFVERTFEIDESETINFYGTSSIIDASGSFDDFIFPGTESIQEGNFVAEPRQSNLTEDNATFHLAYHTDPNHNNLYLGDGGSQTITKYYTNSTNAPTKFNYPLDGTGVDFINCEPVSHFHHEFFDKNGNSRVQYIDWYETIGESDKTQPIYLYRNSSTGYDHGTMTTSLAAGLVNGFAKNATIYICPISIQDIFGATENNSNQIYGFSLPEGFRIIKKFHEQKPIDPNTGYKRPTVINLSLAFDTTANASAWAYPDTLTNKNLRSLKNTASINLSNISENDGIRFEYGGMNLTIVSSSINSSDLNLSYKGVKNNYHVIKFNDKTDIHNIINNTIFSVGKKVSECFISCSLSSDNNTLEVTSSFQNFPNPNLGTKQRKIVYIYTGSFNQNNNHFPTTTGIKDNTGSLVDTLGDPSIWPSNRIDSIVINGVEQVTDGSNNNFLNVSHYCPNSFPNKDYFGNDLSSSGFPHYSNDGVTLNSHLMAPTFDIYSPTLNEIFEDLANSGVIICKAAGNRGIYISQTGSAENPFFDPSKCDNILANNYFQKDVDTGTIFEANTPIYYNRAQPSNGSAILVGNGPNKSTSNFSYSMDSNSVGFPFLASSGNSGPGVDVYSPGTQIICAAPRNYSSQFTTDHNILSNINFDTSSVLTTIENNFSSLYSNTNFFHRTSSTAYRYSFSGGTSASSPVVAGIICCYVQAHPWANVKDIRNWIKSINTATIPTFSDIHTNPLLFKRIYSTDITGSRFNLSVSESQAMQLGTDNSRIMYFPFNKPNPIEMTGSIKMSNVNFNL